MNDKGMYCSTCGTLLPDGSRSCIACGTRVAPRSNSLAAQGGGFIQEHPARPLSRSHHCPRCGYQGEGVGYFSRGRHVAALIGVTMITMAAMGAGGLVYYLVRRDHLVCPRCGLAWGPEGTRALSRRSREGHELEPRETAIPRDGSWKRGWAITLFLVAASLMMIGLLAGEVGLIAGALFSAGGGAVLLQAAGRERERRREALVASLQLPVLKLATQHGGRLTVTEVAAHLGWPLRRAEKILQSLDDGIRVDSQVTDEGVIVYEFRELARGTPPSDLRLGEGGA